MIIILLFATFVSLFFQSAQYKVENFDTMETSAEPESAEPEGLAELGHDEAGHDEAGHDEAGHDEAGHDEAGHDEAGHDDEIDLTNAQIEHDEKPHKSVADKKGGPDKKKISVTKAAKLKKDMKDYFDVQAKLLDVLEKAEPLQEEAMAIKERFNTNTEKE